MISDSTFDKYRDYLQLAQRAFAAGQAERGRVLLRELERMIAGGETMPNEAVTPGASVANAQGGQQPSAETLLLKAMKKATGCNVVETRNALGSVIELQGSGYDTTWEVRLQIKPLLEMLDAFVAQAIAADRCKLGRAQPAASDLERAKQLILLLPEFDLLDENSWPSMEQTLAAALAEARQEERHKLLADDDETIEAMARAICAVKGVSADALHQRYPGDRDYPIDEMKHGYGGGEYYRGWRIQAKFARAALAALRKKAGVG
jgi:hypothetical protein